MRKKIAMRVTNISQPQQSSTKQWLNKQIGTTDKFVKSQLKYVNTVAGNESKIAWQYSVFLLQPPTLPSALRRAIQQRKSCIKKRCRKPLKQNDKSPLLRAIEQNRSKNGKHKPTVGFLLHAGLRIKYCPQRSTSGRKCKFTNAWALFYFLVKCIILVFLDVL